MNNNITLVSSNSLRILIVMDEGIGNMVMLTPTIRALKELLPDCEITVLGKQSAIQVVDGIAIGIEALTGEPLIPEEGYDICFLSIWSITLGREYEEKIYDWCTLVYRIGGLTRETADKHESLHHLQIAQHLGYKGKLPAPYCAVKEVDIKFPGGKKVVALSDTTLPNGHWKRKRWPYYKELAAELIKRNYTVVLIGGKAEAERYKEVEWPPYGIINCLGKHDIQENAGILKKCDMFIGNDSGPAHMAAALDIPTYVLFGATLISKNKPLGKNAHIIAREMPCRPCQYTEQWQKCKDWKCMSLITVDDVLGVIKAPSQADDNKAVLEQSVNVKKVLMVGVLDVASSTNVFMAKGFAKLGYEVEAYNYRTRIKELGNQQAMWDDFMKFLEGKRYELIMFCKVDSLHPSLISHAREVGKTWYWFADNIEVAKTIAADLHVKAANYISATSSEVVDWFQESSPDVCQIIEGYDPETYYHEDLEKLYDVVFIGNATEKRIEQLGELRKTCDLTIFGNGWPEEFREQAPVYNNDERIVICQSKIILNLVHSNIFSDRVVKTMACGGFVLSEKCDDLKQYFNKGLAIGIFYSVEDAVKQIGFYLGQSVERYEIARRGSGVVQKYKWENVCRNIFQIAKEGLDET